MPEPPYPSVRALVRGLDLLKTLAQAGPSTAAELAKLAGVDRATAYRLLETMRREGYVAQNETSRTFSLALGVRQIYEGFNSVDLAGQIVSAELGRLLLEIKWPSNYATLGSNGAMVERESTHRYSPYAVRRSVIGASRPLMYSALGQAVLAAAAPDERSRMIELAARMNQPGAGDEMTAHRLRGLIDDFHAKGYASSIDGAEAGISAIALPVRGPGDLLGAINIVHFSRVMNPAETARRYLGNLRETVRRVERQLRDVTI